MKLGRMGRWLRLVTPGILLGVLSIGATCPPGRNHDEVFTREGLLAANSTDLSRSFVSAVLDVPIQPGQNVIWCGTFQLAWNETCSLIGEDLAFAEPSPLADLLNKKSFVKSDVDDASYVALAGFVRDGIHKKIRCALDEKFHGLARPRLIPSKEITPRPQDIVAYAYLFKNLEFATPFERLDRPLEFGGTEVSSFGLGPFKPGQVAMYPQVLIFDYKSENDFVIELKTKSEGDRLILAKVKPGETLASTVVTVEKRVAASTGEQASVGDLLTVPKFNFDVTRSFEELERNLLVPRNPEVAKDLFILSAVQNIRFQMDEKGVKLRSEAHMAIGCAMEVPPQPQHIMIFDRPFLVLLKRAGAKTPYFAMWVDNPELLVSW